uniref:Major intrinsically disordered Notch2-binding receptor 1-like C-terminal domain-containing protein n=1 Tax=Esox lucius TaxID=8010 RepID=A0A3P8YJA3_ESOLU
MHLPFNAPQPPYGAHGLSRLAMDISVLPNNNHPEKFLQLDVGMLPASHGMFQVGAALSGQRQWSNQVYQQFGVQEIVLTRSTPLNALKNPLYTDIRTTDVEPNQRSKPSWTIQEFDRHSIHSDLAGHSKEEEKDPQDLDFWLEDLYTPGYDSLLKKREAEMKRKRFCKILTCVFFLVSFITKLVVYF